MQKDIHSVCYIENKNVKSSLFKNQSQVVPLKGEVVKIKGKHYIVTGVEYELYDSFCYVKVYLDS
jgi:hypothetical protein